MGKFFQAVSERLSLARELYIWGWRWVVFVIWGLPYGLVGTYDLLQGQGFLSSDYPLISQIVPNWLPQAWFMVGVIAIIIVTFEGAYRITRQSIPSDSEVTDVIRLLEAETLVLKNDEEGERSYSFAEVFLAIADQLSIGISLIQFEGKIRKELCIDEKAGWYFPYEDEGITHLIGVLDQNTLVDRRNEEYQRMVGGLDYYSISISLNPPPKEHLSKGTETKYYLSLLGRRVIRQLR